jgi:ribosomal protein S18 acetylase RimI-like enzyme
MPGITISPAARGDIPFLAECRYGMFQAMHPEKEYGEIRQQFVEAACAYFRDHFDDPLMASLCARATAGPVGCGIILFQKRPPHIMNFDNLFGYILNVFVVPEFRREGIATRIMRELQAEAARRGVRRIGLNASEEGMCVYRGLGYAVKGNYMETEFDILNGK